MAEDEERRQTPIAAHDAAGTNRQEPPPLEGEVTKIGSEAGNPSDAVPSTQSTLTAGRDVIGSAEPVGSSPISGEAADIASADDQAIADAMGSTPGLAEPATAAWPDVERADVAAPAAVPPVTAEPSPSFGALPAILGIVLLLMLGALAYLFYAQPGPERLDATDANIADIKARMAAIEAKSTTPPDVSNLKQRLDGSDQQLAGLTSTVATLQKQVETLGTAPAAAAPAAATDTVAPQIAGLDGKITDLGRDIADIRTTIANLPKPDFGPVDGKIGDLDTRLAALQTKVDAIPTVDLTPLSTRLNGLDGRLKPIEAEAEAAKTPQRVTDIRQNGSAAETRAAPLAVTAQAVVRAIGAGEPFPADVKVLESLGADPKALQPLQAVAANGAPTLKQLRGELAAMRERVLVGSTPAPSGSYLDRLMAGAGTLVQVRPLGSVVGDTPAAIMARMDEDLGNNELDAALTEWQKLPERARTESKGLADRIGLRLSAETAARSIASDAIGAMASTKP